MIPGVEREGTPSCGAGTAVLSGPGSPSTESLIQSLEKEQTEQQSFLVLAYHGLKVSYSC